MASSYPGGLDSITNPTASDPLNSATVPHATQHANSNDAIEAIQAELGTDPAGASATVKARFDAIEANDWVTSARIAANAVGTTEIADSAVTSGKIADGTIVDADVNASAAIAQSKIANLTSDLAGKAAYTDLPYLAVVPGIVQPTASSGLSSQVYLAAAVYNAGVTTTTTINGYLEWSVMVAAGTYTLRTAWFARTDGAIFTIAVDGSNLGTTIDSYAAASAQNNITDITGIALTAGRHTIRYTGATKNASSTAYRVYLHGLSLTRTGA